MKTLALSLLCIPLVYGWSGMLAEVSLLITAIILYVALIRYMKHITLN